MEKIRQIIPPGTLNIFYILGTPTDCAQMSTFSLAHPDPGGATILFLPNSSEFSNSTILIRCLFGVQIPTQKSKLIGKNAQYWYF